jgi:hypothetical protein
MHNTVTHVIAWTFGMISSCCILSQGSGFSSLCLGARGIRGMTGVQQLQRQRTLNKAANLCYLDASGIGAHKVKKYPDFVEKAPASRSLGFSGSRKCRVLCRSFFPALVRTALGSLIVPLQQLHAVPAVSLLHVELAIFMCRASFPVHLGLRLSKDAFKLCNYQRTVGVCDVEHER